MDPFKDRVAVITGGAGGIGMAMARAFAERGARIVLADLDDAALGRATQELSGAGCQVLGVRTDVTAPDSVERLADGAPSDVYNLGNGSGFSVREVIAAAERVTGKRIPAVAAPRRPGDPPTLVGSSEKARRELGWRPRLASLEAILSTAWAWHGGRGLAAGEQGARHPS